MSKMCLKSRGEPNGRTPLPKCPGIKGIHKYVLNTVTNILGASTFYSQKEKKKSLQAKTHLFSCKEIKSYKLCMNQVSVLKITNRSNSKKAATPRQGWRDFEDFHQTMSPAVKSFTKQVFIL